MAGTGTLPQTTWDSHTLTLTLTLTHTQTLTLTLTQSYSHWHLNSHSHTRSNHAFTHARLTHAHRLSHTLTLTHTHYTHNQSYSRRTLTHTYSHPQSYLHSLTLTLSRVHSYSHSLTYSHTGCVFLSHFQGAEEKYQGFKHLKYERLSVIWKNCALVLWWSIFLYPTKCYASKSTPGPKAHSRTVLARSPPQTWGKKNNLPPGRIDHLTLSSDRWSADHWITSKNLNRSTLDIITNSRKKQFSKNLKFQHARLVMLEFSKCSRPQKKKGIVPPSNILLSFHPTLGGWSL